MSVPDGCDETLLSYLSSKRARKSWRPKQRPKSGKDQLKKRTLLTVELKTKRVLTITMEGKTAAKEAQNFQEVTQFNAWTQS